jgi:hypothetical protein
MPSFNVNPPPYRPKKDLQAEWGSFRKGLNLLLRPTELRRDEMAQADNIMLVGSGVPTGRWGTTSYFAAASTSVAIRGLGAFRNNASSINEIIAASDSGKLVKRNGSGFTPLSGAFSFPSGTTVRSAQLGGNLYLVSEFSPFIKYVGSAISVFATLSAPTGLSATNFSGATGTNTYSWVVTTTSVTGGETTPSTNILLTNLPQDLSRTQINLRWTAPSAAASTISGYSIYRGAQGTERFLAQVNASTTTYVDTGAASAESILTPFTNSTGGIKSRFVKVFKDRLLVVPKDDPTRLDISAKFPDETRFNVGDGGGSVYISPNDGFDITGIEIQPGSDRIVVFKESGSFSVELSSVQIGNFTILDPQYQPISTAVGCSSQDSVVVVENDIFYFGRKGLYVVGYEPNFLSIIRTNEISARVRPYLDQLNSTDYETANAFYVKNMYILHFPDRKEALVYDRERGAFAGIWKMPYGINHCLKYLDSSGTEQYVIGSNTGGLVYRYSSALNSDSGTTITKTIRTGKDSFDAWYLLKIIKLFYILFREISGSVTVNILLEDRNGETSNVKTFTITGAAVSGQSGWGSNIWGSQLWGSTTGEPTVSSEELYRWGQLFKQGRLVQVEISCTEPNSNFELLGIRLTASAQGEGSLASSARV